MATLGELKQRGREKRVLVHYDIPATEEGNAFRTTFLPVIEALGFGSLTESVYQGQIQDNEKARKELVQRLTEAAAKAPEGTKIFLEVSEIHDIGSTIESVPIVLV